MQISLIRITGTHTISWWLQAGLAVLWFNTAHLKALRLQRLLNEFCQVFLGPSIPADFKIRLWGLEVIHKKQK